MSFKKTFCPSPWFHMRINNSGTYEYCRWRTKNESTRVNYKNNIATVAPLEYFQKTMAPLRKSLLDGEAPAQCGDCYRMEEHGKVSGRQRQLLKVGVLDSHFEKSLASSPLRSDFDYSFKHNGLTKRSITDWQIDLGNFCNSACMFCNAESSSRLAVELKKLNLIQELPPAAWCDDPVQLEQFIAGIKDITDLQYLHFIGGETVITPAFKQILLGLIDADLAKNITIGFTTNLTVWDDELADTILPKFKMVNLGMSVETLNSVNDYVRYPSALGRTYQLLERWRRLGQEHGWLLQLRITPSCLTIHNLASVYDYAWNHGLAVESCNFLDEPKFMRISVLPREQREAARNSLVEWIINHPIDIQQQIINTRDPNIAHIQIRQDAESYVDYLDHAEDESFRLPELVEYIKRLESNRNNSILDYIPEYEQLLRSAGY